MLPGYAPNINSNVGQNALIFLDTTAFPFPCGATMQTQLS